MKSKEPKEVEVMTLDLKPFVGPTMNLLAAVVIGVSLVVSAGILSKGGVAVTTTTATGSTSSTATDTGTTTASVTTEKVRTLFTSNNIFFGDPNSNLLFAEFSDPSCPYCHVAGGKDPELNKQVGDRFVAVADGGTYIPPVEEMRKLVDQGKAAFVWVYTNGHGNGEIGTQALFCANEKGKFWEVHDILMSNAGYNMLNTTVQNDKTKAPALAELTKGVVDATEMTNCIQSGKYAPKLSEGISTAGDFGVSGTPGFFVNDKNYAGAYSFSDMQATVNQYL